MEEEKKCCGTCKYHVRSCGEWVCMEEASIGYALETDYDDLCPDWEERGNGKRSH